MAKKIFAFSFLAACIVQGFIFMRLGLIDFSMWARQAEYVETGNPAQFDYLKAYGHPGGPIIEGAISIHSLFKLPYESALLIFLTIVDGLAIAGASVISFLLSKNHLWWPVVLATFSSNWLYAFSSPPSVIASIFIGSLCLFSLYLCKKEKVELASLVFWGMAAGFIIATRTDIGAIVVAALLIFIKPKISWQKFFGVLLSIVASFILFDPFMWFMPIRHLGDLLFKIFYHYEYIAPNILTAPLIINVSSFLLVGAVFSIISIFMKEKIKPFLPLRFVYILLAVTVLLYTVFLTAHYQALRYFLPIVSIWEIFLPVFIFPLTANLEKNISRKINIFLAVILTASPLLSAIILGS